MTNKLCKLLGIHSPIIQEPIHTLTNGKFISAVSEAGFLGFLGINAGYHVNTSADATTSASASDSTTVGDPNNYAILDTMTERNLMNEQINAALERTFRPFGVEIASAKQSPTEDPIADSLVALMRKRRITIAYFEGFGHLISTAWLKVLKDNGIRIIERINSVEEAVEEQEKGVDVLLAGQELIPAIRAKIPTAILVARGVVTAAEVKQAFAAGADGISNRLLFYTSEEALTAEAIKQQYVEATKDKLVSFKLPFGTVYSLPGKLPDNLATSTSSPAELWEQANRYQGLINGFVKGDLEAGWTDTEADVDVVTKIAPVEQQLAEVLAAIPEG
ncbi:nitronate monooxygenase [Lactobacillus corticis]|uniref:Nitronate monooxygenase domain-containing protein n=1 Tax=Lactobacillus corticis TaxID=2201249 RepID=A0A916QKA5_9LACO|nr:nitronate monooxygenase [Lactobacillus corticis]GFZ27477.1 hypothetical protein LCB40_13570 [Lactobacillus corticis]